MAHFEVFRDSAGDSGWRLKATNGEVRASTDGYKTKAAAVRGVEDLVRAAHDATTTTANGGWGNMHELKLDIREVDS